MSDRAAPDEPRPTKIAHLGIAVRSIDDALGFYRDQLGLEVSEIVEVPERGLRVAMLPCGESLLELRAYDEAREAFAAAHEAVLKSNGEDDASTASIEANQAKLLSETS